MRLSTKTRYGTRLLLDIALHGDNGPVRILDVAKRQKISAKYLERIVQQLKKAGFIKSRRGHKGGHVLAKLPEDITIGAIIRLMEEEPGLVECVYSENACEKADNCATRQAWVRACKAMYDELDAITLADLVANSTHGVDI